MKLKVIGVISSKTQIVSICYFPDIKVFMRKVLEKSEDISINRSTLKALYSLSTLMYSLESSASTTKFPFCRVV